MVYHTPSHSHSRHRIHRKRLLDYFLPLFIFISFAVIVILGWQLYRSIASKSELMDVYLFIPEGQAKILPWGSYNWDNAVNETRVLQGDEIQTQLESRGVIRFFQKLFLRIDQETTVVLTEVSPGRSRDTYDIAMKGGALWLNTQKYDDKDMELTVRTTNLVIQSSDGVFEIEDREGAEIVRVVRGLVEVAVMVKEGTSQREVESVKVPAGQEFVMDADAYEAYKKYQSPEVFGPISQMFIETGWYLWNSSEDGNYLR